MYSFYFIPILFILSCSQISQNIQRKIAQTERKGWKVVWSDEFGGKENIGNTGESLECFERVPVCHQTYSNEVQCPEFTENLKDLNKCNWSVFNHYNWMDSDAEEKYRINAFSANQVEVKNGMLNLKAQLISKEKFPTCGAVTDPNLDKTAWNSNCPIESGGISSQPNSLNPGFSQQEGRFEVRAKIPYGLASWPAHWLLPQGGGWPQHGEIDIMEAWYKDEDHIYGNFHTSGLSTGKHVSKGESIKSEHSKWHEGFHNYFVEWDSDRIIWGVDNKQYLLIRKGEEIENEKWEYLKHPFFFILNTTVSTHHNLEKNKPSDFNDFKDLEHLIDYVRVYKKCELNTQDCIDFSANYFNTSVNNYNKRTSGVNITVYAYPIPIQAGGELNVEFKLDDNCKKMELSLYDQFRELRKVDLEQPEFVAGKTYFAQTRAPITNGVSFLRFQASDCSSKRKTQKTVKLLILD